MPKRNSGMRGPLHLMGVPAAQAVENLLALAGVVSVDSAPRPDVTAVSASVQGLPPATMRAKVEAALCDAERKAWMSLAAYKFWMFGYHAAQWVLLKSLMPAHIRNPFKQLVLLAKQVVAERNYKGEDHG